MDALIEYEERMANFRPAPVSEAEAKMGEEIDDILAGKTATTERRTSLLALGGSGSRSKIKW
jgi:hypothetical protein